MTSKTRLSLISDVINNITSGGAAGITGEKLRVRLLDFLDSLPNENNAESFKVASKTITLAMTDGVVADIFPAVEPGVPDEWRFNQGASWYTETRTTGRYLGEYANVATAAGVNGAAVADYYYDTTSKTYQELTDIGTPASTETFRAGSAEFPAGIVVFAQDDRVVICDAKDGSMWMVFVSASQNMIAWNNSGVVDYKNGLLVEGQANYDAHAVDFKKDTGTTYQTAAAYRYSGTIAQRNDTLNADVLSGHGTILSRNVKAVAIGDAKDHYGFDEWGVPKQFIAVGCDTTHGVSVIHPNGKVYDITGNNGAVTFVGFNKYGEIIARGNTDQTLVYNLPFRNITTGDPVQQHWAMSLADGSALRHPTIWVDSSTQIGGNAVIGDKNINFDATIPVVSVFDIDMYGTGNNNGGDSLASYIGYDSVLSEQFHSPLVDRSCTAAIGMETGTTDLVETEQITNAADRDFSSDTGNWTGDTGVSITAGVLRFSSVAINDQARLDDAATTVVEGKVYAVTYTISGLTSNGIKVAVGAGSYGPNRTANGTYTDYLIAGSVASQSLFIQTVTGSTTLDIDDISIKPCSQDRSQLNTNHAKINGTITRAAYDGGDVVMHSGASGGGTNTGAFWSNGLDAFSTNGAIFEGVVGHTAGVYQNLLSNRPVDGSGDPRTSASAAGSNGSAIYIAGSDILTLLDDNGSTTTFTSLSNAISSGLHHIVIILSSSDFYVYVDGELDKVTASVTVTAPTDPVTYIHPDGMAWYLLNQLDRKATADYYMGRYRKIRRFFNNGAKCTLQGTGNIVDIAIDEARKTYTVLQTDHWTTFDMDNSVIDDGVVSNTGVSIGAHDGDRVILDGSNLTITTAEKLLSNNCADRVKDKRVFEYDSLVEANSGVFGTTITNPPNTSGDTVGGAILDWDGAESTDPTITDLLTTLFDDEAGSYLVGFTVANRTTGTIQIDISGTTGTARSTNATFSETLVYDPAASSSSDLVFNDNGTAFDGQVSDYRIRKVGTPYWLPKGWKIVTVYEDGAKVRPDTPDLVRDGAIVRDGDGKEGWLSSSDTWITLSIEAVEEI